MEGQDGLGPPSIGMIWNGMEGMEYAVFYRLVCRCAFLWQTWRVNYFEVRTMRRLFIFLSFALTGCQAMVYGTATDFEKLSIGMEKAQVIQALGQPVSVGANGANREEYLTYKRMNHAISAWPRDYQVTLVDGKVAKYGEK